MRNLLTLSAAASVLVLGISIHQAAAISPDAKATSSDGLVLKVQKSEDKGPATRGQDGGGKSVSPGAAQDKGKGTAQGKEGDRGAGMRAGEKGARTDVDVDVRGKRGDRDRADRRTRVDIGVDERRRRAGRSDVDVNVRGRGYGYTAGGCQDLLRRYKQCIAR